MILDYENEFSQHASTKASGQAFAGTAGTAVLGGRVMDAGRARDWAAGEPVQPYVRVSTAAGGASGGWTFDIVGADNEALDSNPVVLSTKTITTAALAINTLHSLPVLAAGSLKRYLGLKVTSLTSNGTLLVAVVGLRDKSGVPQNIVNTL